MSRQKSIKIWGPGARPLCHHEQKSSDGDIMLAARFINTFSIGEQEQADEQLILLIRHAIQMDIRDLITGRAV